MFNVNRIRLRKWAYALGACVVMLGIGFLGVKLFNSSHAATTAWSFAPSGLNGSGFQNVVAYSPFRDAAGKRPVVMGADIAGIHRSLDGGRTWITSNVGLGNNHVASVMFSDTTAGKVYAATDTGIFVSTNFGQTWSKKAGAVDFDANGVYLLPGYGEHPRPTGNLLAQDNSGTTKYLYAATATQGVKRSSDDGTTWERVSMAGVRMRSVALDPANPDRLYVATAGTGMHVSTNARGLMTFARAGAGPDFPEELKFVNGKLYIAANRAGMFTYNGTAWQALNNGIGLTSIWLSINGHRDSAGRTVLYAGCADPVGGKHLMKSVDGGVSWTPISVLNATTTMSRLEYGQISEWWAADHSYLGFNNINFVSADVAIDPDNPNNLILAGRGGAKAAEQTATGTKWWPSVKDLMVTVNMAAVADPNRSGRVYVGSMDYTFLPSVDNGKTIISDTKPVGAPSTGDYIALDTNVPAGTPSIVYLAASVRGQNTGSGFLYSNPDPVANPANWTNENIPVVNDVLSVGVGRNTAGGRVILASITNNGLYRKEGAVWTKLTGTTPFLTGGYGTFAWKKGTQIVYAVDSVGVWRSSAAGAQGSWTKLANATADYGNIDAVVIDPNNVNTIYVSDNTLGGVARITGTNTATPVRTTILTLANPGPVVISNDGELLVHDRAGARLMRSASPAAAAPTFTNVANTFYANNNDNIRSMAIGPDDYVYTANNGAGFTVGTPAGTVNPPPPPPPPPGNGDANGDGRVNALDLSIVLAKDGQNYPAADFAVPTGVGAEDLAIVLSRWTW